MPFSTEGIKFLGMAPPKISSTNSNPAPRGSGSNRTRQTAELPVAAGLLLVLAFGVGLAANGLAVRHLGRMQLDSTLKRLRSLATTTSMCCCPEPASRNSFVCGSLRETQRQVLFQNLVNALADAVFVGARLRLDGKCDRGFRDPRLGIVNGCGLIAQRIAR